MNRMLRLAVLLRDSPCYPTGALAAMQGANIRVAVPHGMLGRKRQRAAALQNAALWSGGALHRFWGIPGTTPSPIVGNSVMRPVLILILIGWAGS
jgi:hypothetical protein